MKPNRKITCPKCGAVSRIPLLWVLGIEVVFRCSECKYPFKTGYKMGAVLSALGLTISLVCVNLLIFIFGSITLPIMVLVIIPLWVILGFAMRKSYLLIRVRRSERLLAKEKLKEVDQINEPPLS